MSPPDLLIQDALVVPLSGARAEPFHGWVTVAGNRIAGTGPGAPPPGPYGRVIDGRDCALIPGLINTHAHSHSSLTRGTAEGRPLADWLAVIEREQAALTPDEATVAALATYGEALLSGTTTVVDMCLVPAAAIHAARELGLRVVVAPYVASSKPFAPTLAETETLLRAFPAGGRVFVWCGLHELESCGDDEVRAAAALAHRYGTGLHLHCAETQGLVAATIARTGQRPVAHLKALGAVGERTLLAHGVWLDPAERALLAEAGAHVAHCPIANLKLGSGVAPVAELVAAGVNVALGTDGAKANNNLDLFDTLKFASLLPKGWHRDPSLLPADQVLAMATVGGARALGLEAGRIAPGMLADLVLVRLDRFHLQPAGPATIVTNLVHAAKGADVTLVMVDGQVVVEDGRLLSVDWTSLWSAYSATAAALQARPEV